MLTKLFSFRFAGCFLVFGFILLFSCKKDDSVLDTAVQPESDKFSSSVVVPYSVHAYTFPHDSFISFGGGTMFLGSNIDPVFGRTDIGLYVNGNMSRENTNLDTAVFVSAEFKIVCDRSRFQGNSAAQLSFSVFPLETALDANTFYYSSNDRLHSKTALATTTITTPQFGDSVILRIPLDQTYAEQMFADKAAWLSTKNFQSKFKGFYILASPVGAEGQIMTCFLEEPASGLIFKYKESAFFTEIKTFHLTFGGELSAKYNTVKHDYTQATIDLKNQLAGDTASSTHVFVQGFGGTKVRIEIPVQPYVSDSFQLAVSRAELILPIDPIYATSSYTIPDYLSLLPVSASGRDTFALDQANSTDNARYDGVYNKNNGYYVFNIARHVQAILKGQVANRGFNLVLSDPSKVGTMFRDENIERIVLGGSANATYKPTFKLTYSKVSTR